MDPFDRPSSRSGSRRYSTAGASLPPLPPLDLSSTSSYRLPPPRTTGFLASTQDHFSPYMGTRNPAPSPSYSSSGYGFDSPYGSTQLPPLRNIPRPSSPLLSPRQRTSTLGSSGSLGHSYEPPSLGSLSLGSSSGLYGESSLHRPSTSRSRSTHSDVFSSLGPSDLGMSRSYSDPDGFSLGPQTASLAGPTRTRGSSSSFAGGTLSALSPPLTSTGGNSHASRGIRKFSKRTTFSPAQLNEMESLWSQTEYPSIEQIDECAKKGDLSPKQVRTWFGNTRQARLAGTRREARQSPFPGRSRRDTLSVSTAPLFSRSGSMSSGSSLGGASGSASLPPLAPLPLLSTTSRGSGSSSAFPAPLSSGYGSLGMPSVFASAPSRSRRNSTVGFAMPGSSLSGMPSFSDFSSGLSSSGGSSGFGSSGSSLYPSGPTRYSGWPGDEMR